MIKSILFSGLLAVAIATAPPKSTRWTGTIGNGMKGDKISFLVSPDGKLLSDLTFDGYWRCSGRLERRVTGPRDVFPIVKGKVSGVALDPPTGSNWRFELRGNFTGKFAATGTFRMNITGLSCDSNQLQWAAAPVR
ncbi:hypothetical protein BEN47_04105 [Hymenobacter lapidarius]|uniref:Uncharacterized protein n=1 Tax=Hymenobacter lapidarius TaxID=1908237 RepID=A0A1G1SVE9_9BACT|nr:hypothetical protein [Hymenobacter lapidarius]OGX82574.1 hypothetical protein BEN47_04105 [Hymenobacter lapidarius]